MTKKLKIYLDTSVINFLFAADAPEKQEITIEFFENYIEEYDVYISDSVIAEIMRTTNNEKLVLLISAIEKYKLTIYKSISNEIDLLAKIYLENQIVPINQVYDAIHLSFATFYEFDILLSWNFKHLANIKVQNKLRSLNLKIGYLKELLLLNPMELIYDKQS